MFELKNQNTTLTNINIRGENHGEDIEPACDLTMKTTMSNTVLEMFAPHLKESFFKALDDDNNQGELNINDDDYLPALKYKEAGKLPWAYIGLGYRVVIAYGVTTDQDVILVNTTIDSFVLDCNEGGSVEVKFRIKCVPTSDEIGTLYKLIKREIDLTLEPPSIDEKAQQELKAAAEDINKDLD